MCERALIGMTRSRKDAAPWLVVLAGGVAALQVGKLPPALPALQAELGLTLVQSGFLLSMVQLAGMSLAVFMGLWADGMGLKRSMVRGLCLLALASGLGAFATSVTALLVLRAIEGLGFLLVALPAPALIRRLVPPAQLPGMLGVWGAYMPTGTALALLAGPLFIPAWGWGAWWGLFATVSLGMAVVLSRVVPTDPTVVSALVSVTGAMAPQKGEQKGEQNGGQKAHPSQTPNGPWQRLRLTLSTPGPWLVALTFGMYSGQWLAVVGFLPSIYAAAGVGGALLGVLTASAAAVNIVGNLASGRLLQRGWAPRATLWLGFGAMALGSTVAFAAFTEGLPWLRFAGVLLFSGLGGLVPGTLFSLAVRLAPGEQQVATTVGWVQQLSALGQFVGPPLVAAVAARAGGWQFTPLVTVGCCGVGAVLAWMAGRLLSQAQSRP
jgi:MFS family permease